MERNICKLRFLRASLLLACALLTGCTTFNYESRHQRTLRLRILAPNPEHFVIRIPEKADFPVTASGKVILTYSETEMNRSLKYGDLILANRQSSDVKEILLTKGQQLIRRLPTEKLNKLSEDAEGYKILKLD